MTVVTFENYTPAPRYDSTPWVTARIEESSTETGSWTSIEDVTLSPVDSDPKNPATRNFTTELATLTDGWYRIVWVDGDSNEQPTTPVQNIDQDAIVAGVGARLHARTVERGTGTELGTFTSLTRPTYNQVVELINEAAFEIDAEIGADTTAHPRDPRVKQFANAVLTLRVAMLVELSYFPEQVATGRSPYDRLADMYTQQMAVLIKATEQAGAGDEPGASDDDLMPVYAFPIVCDDQLIPSPAWWGGW